MFFLLFSHFSVLHYTTLNMNSEINSGKKPSPIWDRLVFNKIKAKLGGRVRFMGSGASPLSPDVMDFLRV